MERSEIAPGEGFSPPRKSTIPARTPHPSEYVADNRAALSRKGRGRSHVHPRSVRHHIRIDPPARDRQFANAMAAIARDHDRIATGIDAEVIKDGDIAIGDRLAAEPPSLV